MLQKNEIEMLEARARKTRLLITDMIATAGKGHIGGALSIADALCVLYFKVMKIDPKNPRMTGRDRFVLSKGHAGPALYAVLAMRGYFPVEQLKTLNAPGTNLPSHCDMKRTIGVDMTAGSLGQGISAAVGMALAGRLDKLDYTVYFMVGDGECQEGEVWEAAMYGGSQKLGNLIGFVDNNGMQIDGSTADINDVEPLADKWRAFKWEVFEADGHDVSSIYDAIRKAQKVVDKPSMIILKTVKGRGVPFAEGLVASHSMSVTAEDYEAARKLLDYGLEEII